MKSSTTIAAFLACLCVTADAAAADSTKDANGRAFRIDFPTHDRFWVSAGVEDFLAAKPLLGMEWAVQWHADFPDEEIWWQLRNGFLGAQLSTDGNGNAGLVKGEYLRHDVSSFIVVPADVDWRVPAPSSRCATGAPAALWPVVKRSPGASLRLR